MWIQASMSAANLTRLFKIFMWFSLFQSDFSLSESKWKTRTLLEMTKRVRAPIGHIHISRIGVSTRWRLAICPTPGWTIAYKQTKLLDKQSTWYLYCFTHGNTWHHQRGKKTLYWSNYLLLWPLHPSPNAHIDILRKYSIAAIKERNDSIHTKSWKCWCVYKPFHKGISIRSLTCFDCFEAGKKFL